MRIHSLKVLFLTTILALSLSPSLAKALKCEALFRDKESFNSEVIRSYLRQNKTVAKKAPWLEGRMNLLFEAAKDPRANFLRRELSHLEARLKEKKQDRVIEELIPLLEPMQLARGVSRLQWEVMLFRMNPEKIFTGIKSLILPKLRFKEMLKRRAERLLSRDALVKEAKKRGMHRNNSPKDKLYYLYHVHHLVTRSIGLTFTSLTLLHAGFITYLPKIPLLETFNMGPRFLKKVHERGFEKAYKEDILPNSKLASFFHRTSFNLPQWYALSLTAKIVYGTYMTFRPEEARRMPYDQRVLEGELYTAWTSFRQKEGLPYDVRINNEARKDWQEFNYTVYKGNFQIVFLEYYGRMPDFRKEFDRQKWFEYRVNYNKWQREHQ